LHRLIRCERGQASHRYAVAFFDPVVGAGVGERERQDALLLQVGVVDAREAAREDHDTASVARLHCGVLS